MSYKRLIPCILIADGEAVKWFDDREVIAHDEGRTDLLSRRFIVFSDAGVAQ